MKSMKISVTQNIMISQSIFDIVNNYSPQKLLANKQ